MPEPENRYEPTAESPLFILAMDHRASFARTLFGVDGDPTEAQQTKMRDAKMVIYEGACEATADGLITGRAGVLVDEQLGAEVARRAKTDGFVLAMPIEKSGTKLFELEYGDQYPEHVEAFEPDFFKVLVRYNPADAPDDRAVQIERLAEVSTWATGSKRRWLFELLVPATREQLAQSEDQFHFDRDVRPNLTAETIVSFNDGGVHPTIWKLEGYETTEGATRVLRVVAADTTFPAECIVLGRNAPMEQVEHWIDVGAPLPGFAGFAVGRSIWEAALQDLIAGHIERHEAVSVIAGRYRRLIEAYCTARCARRGWRRPHGAVYMAEPPIDTGPGGPDSSVTEGRRHARHQTACVDGGKPPGRGGRSASGEGRSPSRSLEEVSSLSGAARRYRLVNEVVLSSILAPGQTGLSIVARGNFWSDEDRPSGMRRQSVRDAAEQSATKDPRPRWPHTIKRAERSSAVSKMALAMPSKDSLVIGDASYP